MTRIGYLSFATLLLVATPALAKAPWKNPIHSPNGTPIVACHIPDATCYGDHLTAYMGPPDSKFSMHDDGAGWFTISFSGSALSDPATKAEGWKPGGYCGNTNSGGNHFVCGGFQSNSFDICINPNGVLHGSGHFQD
jgi:hypothetical protein